MRALSIIGIVMSVIGLITSIYIMTEAKCHCYCDNDYLYSSGSVPDDAVGGGMISMLVFIFFLVFSIVSLSKGSPSRPHMAQAIPPFTANPFPNYQQQYQQQQYQQQQYQQNPYHQNPYTNPQQNPYQQPQPDQNNPPKTPPTNPWEPK